MSLDKALEELLPDEITIEPFKSVTSGQASTYGTAVTYKAQVVSEYRRMIGRDGRDVVSSARVLIPDRVHIDPRSRITLPAGWVPQQPPILSVKPVGGVIGMHLDSTEIMC